MNYNDMTDFEINIQVALLLGCRVQEEFDERIGFTKDFHEQYPNTIWAVKADGLYREQLCYTGCANDTWPIILENKINIISTADVWVANHCPDLTSTNAADDFGWMHTEDKNPLRAACIVYLMMKDDES